MKAAASQAVNRARHGDDLTVLLHRVLGGGGQCPLRPRHDDDHSETFLTESLGVEIEEVLIVFWTMFRHRIVHNVSPESLDNLHPRGASISSLGMQEFDARLFMRTSR
jgi:hypothetical protein